MFARAQSWVCAARECFFTWAYFGGTLLQLAAHNKFRHNLKRDTAIAIMVSPNLKLRVVLFSSTDFFLPVFAQMYKKIRTDVMLQCKTATAQAIF